jgi:branched-chain amino acid transport system substrate-binding protein
MAAQRASGNVTRRQFVTGVGGAAAGGLVVGGAGGFFGGRASKSSNASTGASAKGGGGTVTVGAGIPITGAFAGDGQEMRRGLELGVDAINARGGIVGRQLKLSFLDAKEQQADVMKSVVRKFVSDKVAAIFIPFCTYQNAEFPIAAQSKIPTFHVNTFQGNADWVQQHNVDNIYQADPSQIWYGPGFALVVDDIVKKNLWKPHAKTIAVVTSNDPYSLTIAQAFQKSVEASGWKTNLFEKFTIPQTDWGTVLVKIRANPPGVIFFSDYTAGDEASFMKQFRQSPTPSLVYQQYAPSVPEYLQLAGDAANGVLWSTVVGTLTTDAIGKDFIAKYQARYNQRPGLSNAGGQYDAILVWAEAAAIAGDPFDYNGVNAVLKNIIYRGASGAIKFQPGILTLYPYPDKLDDPSLGMPHLTFQIQNQQQALISPAPYADKQFTLPDWL